MRKLFKHQADAVKRFKKEKSLLLNHEMGLGKTFTAIRCMEAVGVKDVLVIVPKFLKTTWEDELKQAVDPSIFNIQTYTKLEVEDPPEAVIIDESHFIKSYKSLRTRKCLELIKLGQPKYLLLLSGTPCPQTEMDIFTQLMALDYVKPRFFKRDGKRYCFFPSRDDPQKRTNNRYFFFRNFFLKPTPVITKNYKGMTYKGVLENKKAQFEVVKSVFIDTVKKEDVWENMPPIIESDYHVCSRKIKSIETSFKTKKLASELEDFLVKNKYPSPEFFTLLTMLTKEKTRLSRDFIESFRGSGKTAIFYKYREAESELFDLTPYRITSEVKPEERLSVIQQFKKSKEPFLVLSIGCGAIGLNINFLSRVIFVDRPFVYGELKQAIARGHRLNRKVHLDVHYVKARPSILESRFDAILERKKEIDESF